MIKKIFLFVLIISSVVFSQQLNDRFDNAVNLYNNNEYADAYKEFSELSSDNSLDIQKRAAAKYYEGNCLLNMNELNGAVIELEKFIDSYKTSNFREEALYKLGSAYFMKGEFRKARERLLFLITIYPGTEYLGSAYYWLAEAYAGENMNYEADDYFKKAIAEYSTNKYIVNSYYSLAQLYEKLNNFESAVNYYDELLAYYKNDPLAPKAQWRIGICYFNLKKYDYAVLELSDPMIKNLPVEVQNDVNYFLANAHARLKEYKEAQNIYEEVLKNDLKNDFKDKINYGLAWVSFQTGNYEKAYNIFEELQKSSDDSLAINSLYWSGEAKRYLGDSKTANEIYNNFIAKYPEHPLASRAQLSMGTVFFGTDNPLEAEKMLLKASISKDPATKGKANTLLGEMRLNQKNFEQARDYFHTALKYTKGDDELLNRASLGMGVANFYLDNISDAANQLETLKKRDENFEKDKVNFYLAECYLARGEYSAALKYYKMLNANADVFKKQSLYGKAYAYFNMKDYPNAIYFFNDYISKYKKESNIPDAKLRLADSYYGMKNFNKASGIYSELFSSNKKILDNDLTFYQYCQSLYKAGKSSEALNEFKNLQMRFPRSKYADAAQYVIGWIYFQQSNYSDAIVNYKKAISKYPNSSLIPIVYYSLGDSYFNEGQYDSSIVFYSKVLDEYSNTSYILDAANGIQYAYVSKGEPDRAAYFIDQFVAQHPSSKFADQVFFKKGDILYSAEKYDGAIQAYREFLAKYPSSKLVPNAYYWIGKSAGNLKKTSDAINNFYSVVNGWLKSDIGLSATIELANIYSAQKNYSSAVKVLNAVTDAMPTSNRVPELLYMKGVAETNNNQQQDAYQTFDQIVKYYETSVFSDKAKVELGILELNKNNLERAQSLFKELGEKRVDDIGAEAQYYYGLTLFKQNKIDDAVSALVRVRSIFAGYDEWYSKSLITLGDCYVKLKDKKQAREMYREVIERHQTGELAQEAKRKLRQL
jgi:TolA-binding protein